MHAIALLLSLVAAPDWGEDLLLDAGGRDGLDSFHVLGFSRDGLFAYLVDGCGDEAGFSCSDAVVVDLESDRPIDRVSWSDDAQYGESGPVPASDLDRVQYTRNVRAMLRKRGIDHKGRLVKGAALVAEQRFKVVVSSKLNVTGHDDFTRASDILLERGEASKRIGSIQRKSPFGDPYAPVPLAIVASPYERRVAVLLLENLYAGCIGGRPHVTVMGADLDARFP